MKRFCLILTFVLAIAATADTSSPGLSGQLRASEAKDAPVAGEVKLYGQSYALVIGIDAYTIWPRLKQTESTET